MALGPQVSETPNVHALEAILKTAPNDEVGRNEALLWEQVFYAVSEPYNRPLNKRIFTGSRGRHNEKISAPLPALVNGSKGFQPRVGRTALKNLLDSPMDDFLKVETLQYQVELKPDDLFSSLRYPYMDIRADFAMFLVHQKKELPVNCARWALSLCTVLAQLAEQMQFAASSMTLLGWDLEILDDALDTLHYSIYDFLGPVARVLKMHCNDRRDELYNGSDIVDIETFGDVAKHCDECILDAELSLISLVYQLSRQREASGDEDYELMKISILPMLRMFKESLDDPVPNKVPTSGFTELMLQNEIRVLQPFIANLSLENTSSMEENISRLLDEMRQAKPESPLKDKAHVAGIPRCMTIVVDRNTGILVTGATKPAFDPDFPWLDKIGKEVHRLRISQSFRRAIHLCSENVDQLLVATKDSLKMKPVQPILRDQGVIKKQQIVDIMKELDDGSVRELHSRYMTATKQTRELARLPRPQKANHDPLPAIGHDWYTRMLPYSYSEGYEAIPGLEDPIFSWAIDTNSLTLKHPCLRCQRLYSHWYLWGNPKDAADARLALQGLQAQNALSFNKKNDTCSYCAETAAAAQIYLLRRGKLALR